MKTKVYIRADGSTDIGLGHVIRSLALADMLKKDFDCIFATRFISSYIEKEARKVCVDICKLPESEEHFDAFLSLLKGDEIVVLDNYFYTTDYQKSIKEKGCKLVYIDDIHDKHFVADIVINHAGGLDRKLYANSGYSALYIGTEYALLRNAFLFRKRNEGNGILITMGGADKNNAVLGVLKLLEAKNIRKTCSVIIGDAYHYLDELNEFSRRSGLDIQIYKNLSAEQLAVVMLMSQIIICPPSTISYEYLSLCGGEMYVKIIADNQKDLYDFFTSKKIAFDIADLFIEDPNKVKESTDIQQRYFDGKSVMRIKQIFKRLKQEQKFTLRDAELKDTDLYFKWANDPDERRNAVNQNPILYEEHCAWFEEKRSSEDCFLWVLENGGIAVGQIRFEIVKEYAVLSYFIDNNFRGKGLGLSILRLGIEKLMKLRNNLRFRAIVRKENLTSCHLFERLNFQKKILDVDFIEYTK